MSSADDVLLPKASCSLFFVPFEGETKLLIMIVAGRCVEQYIPNQCRSSEVKYNCISIHDCLNDPHLRSIGSTAKAVV
jgi:hypothetical protein